MLYRLRLSYLLVLILLALPLLFPAHSQADGAAAGEGKAALESLTKEALSFFQPVTARITSLNGTTVTLDRGTEGGMRTGMRLQAFKEGAAFIHPVTKEALGRVELPVGEIEVTGASPAECTGRIIKGNPSDFQDAKGKIRGTKIRALFSQGNVEWLLGDSYYQLLKESGRFELIDTASQEIAAMKAEAEQKSADLIITLSSAETKVTQKLFRTDNAQPFSDKTVTIGPEYLKDLKASSGIFLPKDNEAILSFQLPYSARRIAMGDLDGDGNTDILVASGDKLRAYNPGVDLKPLWEITVPSTSDILWLDTTDLDKDKKDEIIITTIDSAANVASYIYGFRDSGFVIIAQAKDMFIRTLGNGLIGQAYSKGDGFEGEIFNLRISGGILAKTDPLSLPKGTDIYGFQLLSSPEGKKAALTVDENGFLGLYDDTGRLSWTAKEALGGSPLQFKREAPTIMVDRGTWSVKDRLLAVKGEVLAPWRRPLVSVTKSLGYKSSELRSICWNGITVEERSFLPDISGEITDYAIAGDKLVILSRPLFGIKAQNILKGENPFGTMLAIFSLSGR
ncbi:MAG: VCBS repeat-containing protein [Nitrospirales bacterium]|nr:VCBS repeat-containing protein [Nitrospirales bacterium]